MKNLFQIILLILIFDINFGNQTVNINGNANAFSDFNFYSKPAKGYRNNNYLLKNEVSFELRCLFDFIDSNSYTKSNFNCKSQEKYLPYFNIQNIVSEEQFLTVYNKSIPVFDTFNGKIVDIISKGSQLKILLKGTSQNTVYGRYFWYKVRTTKNSVAWIYSHGTSLDSVSVDCQCVDYIKHSLGIKGFTKDAHKWDIILQGTIKVNMKNQNKNLNFKLTYPKIGTIAIFNTQHPQVNPKYGHIGILKQIIKDGHGQIISVIIEGANHKQPNVEYIKNRCNNISLKEYLYIANAIKFYTPS